MEGKIKVKVKFGKLKNCIEGKSKERALELVTEDAKTRLRNAYPQVENIEVETKMCRYISYNGTETIGIRASASGYIRKRNKSQPNKPHRYFIKDITTTVLYKSLIPRIVETNETVVAYKIRYMNMEKNLYEGGHYVEFSGKGDIPWKQLKNEINKHNQEVINSGFKNDCFVIDPDNLYKDIHLSDYAWYGFILLSDGSWLKLNMKYDSHLDKKYIGIDRKYPLNLDHIPDSNFKVTICNKGNMN